MGMLPGYSYAHRCNDVDPLPRDRCARGCHKPCEKLVLVGFSSEAGQNRRGLHIDFVIRLIIDLI